MKSNKKAGLQISINAIVILILAITVLGIGLAFITGMFQDTIGKLDQVSKSIDKQMRERMEDEPGRLVLENDYLDIKKSGKIRTYFGIRNEDENPDGTEFEVDFICESAFDEDLTETDIDDYIQFEFLKYPRIKRDDIRILPVEIKIDPNAAITTYECSLLIDEGDYASEDLFITVTR